MAYPLTVVSLISVVASLLVTMLSCPAHATSTPFANGIYGYDEAAHNALGAPTNATASAIRGAGQARINATFRPASQGPAGFLAAKSEPAVAEEVVARQVTVLGRYKGGTENFIGEPGFNVLNNPARGTGRWNWTRNKRFIDHAIERDDEIRLVTNPHVPQYSGERLSARAAVSQRQGLHVRQVG